MEDNEYLYHYNAVVTGVYDGDTITVDIDLGMDTWRKGEKIRLARINTPEVRGKERPEGIKSRDWLRKRILGRHIMLETKRDKKGKYGRYIAEIWVHEEDLATFININDELVIEKLAEYVEY
jgi:micrococcal nuclease